MCVLHHEVGLGRACQPNSVLYHVSLCAFVLTPALLDRSVCFYLFFHRLDVRSRLLLMLLKRALRWGDVGEVQELMEVLETGHFDMVIGADLIYQEEVRVFAFLSCSFFFVQHTKYERCDHFLFVLLELLLFLLF